VKRDYRRMHKAADKQWNLTPDKVDAGINTWSDANMHANMLLDLRAALHDMLDEQRETNRILRMAFGVDKKEDET
jgi:hypothetical protein